MGGKYFKDDKPKCSIPKLTVRKCGNTFINVTKLPSTSTGPTQSMAQTPNEIIENLIPIKGSPTGLPPNKLDQPDVTLDTSFPDLIPIKYNADQTLSVSHSATAHVAFRLTQKSSTESIPSKYLVDQKPSTSCAGRKRARSQSGRKAISPCPGPKPTSPRKAKMSRPGPEPITSRITTRSSTKLSPGKYLTDQASCTTRSYLASGVLKLEQTSRTSHENPKTCKPFLPSRPIKNLTDQTPSTPQAGPKPTTSRSGRKSSTFKLDQKPTASRPGLKPGMPRSGQKPTVSQSGGKASTSESDPTTTASRSGRKASTSKSDPKPTATQSGRKASTSKSDPKPTASRSGRKLIRPRSAPKPTTFLSGRKASKSKSDPKPTTSRSGQKPTTSLSSQNSNSTKLGPTTYTPRMDTEWAIPAESNDLPKAASYSMQFLRKIRRKYLKKAVKILYAFIVFKKVKYLVQWKPGKEDKKEDGDIVDAEVAALLWPLTVEMFLENASYKNIISLT